MNNIMFGNNDQPSDNGTSIFVPTRKQLEDSLHFAKKKEQRVWGSGHDHEVARAEVERLEKLLTITHIMMYTYTHEETTHED